MKQKITSRMLAYVYRVGQYLVNLPFVDWILRYCIILPTCYANSARFPPNQNRADVSEVLAHPPCAGAQSLL